jgi:2-dehydro-3-deoxyphosphogluconate aldolase / (4S)-4-hydroxy-2-oxoglutarate aldolase
MTDSGKHPPLRLSPVMPVVVIDDSSQAVPLARALLAGGLTHIEVTLRTPPALEAISTISTEVPEIVVGAGTVTQPSEALAAAEEGARFLVSPASTPELLAGMADTGLPHLPGVSTVTEVLALLERGYKDMKFFPAEAAGGTAFLRAVGSVLPTVRFYPTGGITATSASAYLALPNVASVGGSWITPQPLLADGHWGQITELAHAASSLRRDDNGQPLEPTDKGS